MKHIPEAALEQHVAILGKTGSGKTSTAKLAIEQVVAEGARVCILDPIKSDWWGLTSSADGKHGGLPFHILGGPRGHVPLHASAGKAIGEIVASGALPLSIIDMADFEPGGQAHFFVDFAPTLLRRMRGVVYLVIEEAHLFAPKERSGVGAENMSIHWSKMLATAGRSKGIRLILATQRTQALHNALIGSCDTMITHRLTAPADQEPVVKWLKANTDKETAQRVADSLSSLKTGEGWLCSGEARIFEKRQFPRIETYDNTATPSHDSMEHEVTTAPVDQAALRAIIGEAVQEAAENDPKALRARIRELEQERGAPTELAVDIEALAAAEQRGRIDGMRAAVGWFRDGFNRPLQQIRAAVQRFEGEAAIVISAADAIGAELEKEPPDGVATLVDAPAPSTFPDHIDRNGVEHYREARTPPTRIEYGGGPGGGKTEAARQRREPALRTHAGTSKVSGPQQRILDALAWLESAGISSADRVRTAMFADQSSRSSGYEKNVSTLRTAGLIDYPSGGVLALTAAGRAQTRKPERAITTAALHEAIRRHVSGPQWRILAAAIDAYPAALKREDLAKRSDQSAASSGFEKNVSTLRSLGFIDYPASGQVVALPVLFLKGRK